MYVVLYIDIIYNIQFKGKIGIITPYREQKRLIQDAVARKFDTLEIDVNTVDGFQGQEKDIIMFSCVRSNKTGAMGFLNDKRRLNVAITRAKSSLWIIGDGSTIEEGGKYWKRLVLQAKDDEVYIDASVFSLTHG
jgi:senataxin